MNKPPTPTVIDTRSSPTRWLRAGAVLLGWLLWLQLLAFFLLRYGVPTGDLVNWAAIFALGDGMVAIVLLVAYWHASKWRGVWSIEENGIWQQRWGEERHWLPWYTVDVLKVRGSSVELHGHGRRVIVPFSGDSRILLCTIWERLDRHFDVPWPMEPSTTWNSTQAVVPLILLLTLVVDGAQNWIVPTTADVTRYTVPIGVALASIWTFAARRVPIFVAHRDASE
jgi:hypothetical protein